jgi:hypothetical protein
MQNFLLFQFILIISALQGFSSPDSSRHECITRKNARKALQTAFIHLQSVGSYKDYQGKIRRDHQTLSKSTLGLSSAGSKLCSAKFPKRLHRLVASERKFTPFPLSSTRFRLTNAHSLPSALLFLPTHPLRTRSSSSSLSASIGDADPAIAAIDVCRDGGCLKRVIEPSQDTASDAATPLPGDVVQVWRVRPAAARP